MRFAFRSKDLGPSCFIGIRAKLVTALVAQLTRSALGIYRTEARGGVLYVRLSAGRVWIPKVRTLDDAPCWSMGQRVLSYEGQTVTLRGQPTKGRRDVSLTLLKIDQV